MSGPVSVLVVGPHPDDIELFCGGTVARLVASGATVTLVDLTRGERASRGTPELRAEEAARAAEVLGVADRINLGLPDGEVPADGGGLGEGSALRRLVSVLRARRPELVLSPPARARHPDHEAAHALARRAVFSAGLARLEGEHPPHRASLAASYLMRIGVLPSFVVDVGDVYEIKKRAVAAYASQVQPRADGTLVGAPGALEALEARDRHHGSLIGATHGEGFVTEATIGTLDPVALLRTPSGGPRLFWEVSS